MACRCNLASLSLLIHDILSNLMIFSPILKPRAACSCSVSRSDGVVLQKLDISSAQRMLDYVYRGRSYSFFISLDITASLIQSCLWKSYIRRLNDEFKNAEYHQGIDIQSARAGVVPVISVDDVCSLEKIMSFHSP
jgi:hypothetical protein